MDNKQNRKILKSPVAKRRSRLVPKDQKVTLERVLGLTATSNATLTCDPNTGLIAYPAGCVVVLYNPKKNKQGHIFNVSKKTLISLAFSGDGKHLVTGESGHQPAVRVWDVVEKTQVAEFLGHKFGISCVAFSPNLKYIVSIGTQYDMQVNVWNWRTGSKVASNKVSSKVTSVSFSSDGSYFVTAGMRHVKFWYLDNSKSKINATVPLNGRNGILGDHRNNFFCDVVAGTGLDGKSTFCITQSGFLCQFNEKRQMDKYVDLRTTCANSISVAGKYIFVGGAKGIIRVFDSTSLCYITTLPRPHHLGVDIAAAINPSQINSAKDVDLKYPDTIAVRYDEEHSRITCLYNDHSMYIWDVHDLKKIGKAWSFLYHSSCVYGVEVYPVLEAGLQPILPPHSFFTCSSDNTIRVWNLDPHMAETNNYKSNIYSHELLKIMYMDPSLTSLCDIDYNPSGATDKTDTNYDDKNGIRSIRVSPDGQHLASGDRLGNVRIHELDKLIEIKQIEAHESEVLSLEYSHWKNGPKLLASSSRDRLIHVFDVEQQYGLLQTLSDHSSSISAVKFVHNDDQHKMISCGADKSILFRKLQLDPEFQFTLATHQVEKMTLYDMDIEPMEKFSAIACQDRNVRIYNVKTGKKKKEYKGSLSDDGTLLKMKLDPSGSYAVTSCSDKNLCIIDFYTGELQATMFGHSEIATDVRFMNDCRHLISSSGDGCIFIWRLPQDMTSQMTSRLKDIGHITPQLNNGPTKPEAIKPTIHQDMIDAVMSSDREFMSPERVLKEMDPIHYNSNNSDITPVPNDDNNEFRYSVSDVPAWAKRGDVLQTEEIPEEKAPRRRRGQWGEGQGHTIKIQDGKSVEVDEDRRRFSYLADTANNQIQDVRRETMVLNRPDATPTNMPVIYDAGNDDDDDDDEDAFMPVSSKTFVKQDTQDKSDITWDELYNFDGDDGDQGENTEIIYYPPSESDGSDTMASSYQVFDAGLNSDRRRTQYKHSISINSNADGDSETTDPVSLDDIEDDDDSNNSVPTTPLEDNTKSQTREKFLKDTFENLSFTPNQTDKFVKGLEALEEEVDNVPVGTITSRQSLSARFLSKSQAARNIGPYGSIQRQDNWFDSVQRRKDDMARNLDESRKMLMAMGWKQESPETDVEDPFKSPTSPSDVSNKLEQSKGTTTTPSNDGIKNLTSTLRDHQPPPSPRTPKSLRRCWSNLDLPKTPIPEGKTPTKKSSLTRSASAVGASSKSSDQNTPTSRRSISTSSRPRTLPLDGSGGRVTPTDKSTNKMAGKKDTPTGSQSSTRLSEYKKNKRTSTPNLNRVSLVSPEPKRLSAGSNLAKSKSSSMHNLIFEEEQELTPRGTNRKPRSKWSTKLSTFASVPDLLNPDDDGKLPPVDTAKSDINDNVKGRKTTTKKSPQVGSRSQPEVRLTRRAASTSRLNSDSDKKPAGKKAGSNTLTQQKSVDKGKDRDLMPPPALTNVAKSKHETRFMNRAQQPRRKTTGGSELSFEEAMNILQGNSGILNGKNEKEKRSTSISPTRSKSRLIKNTENEDKTVVELDKDDFVSGAPDSETSSIDSRKSSNSSTSSKSVDKKRDLKETAENAKTRSGITKSSTKVSVKPLQSKDIDIDSLTNEYKDALRDSGVSTQDEDDCPSPSVKERIARLNKHTSVTSDKRSTPNSIKTLTRADSPVSNSSNSPRQTSSIQINFSSSPSMSTGSSISTSTSNDNITIIDNSASPVRTGDFNQSNVHINTDDTTSINQTTGTSHSMLPNTNTSPVAGMATSLTSDTRTSPASGMATSLTSDTRTSPNSGLGTSLDSEGLSHHLSPGNQSAGSPRSVADTGLGSDTDLDSSQTFRRGQLIGPGDIHSMVDKMDQMLVLMNQISTQYKQIPDTRENGYQDLTSECNQRFTRLCQTYCDTFNISLLSLTGKQEILNDTINELQRNMQKVKDLINS